MKKQVLFILPILLFSCSTSKINEKYAAKIAKEKLSLTEPLTAEVLKGGYSGAPVFTITSNSKKYVIRFIEHKSQKDREQEILCLQAASDGGYGPHIYFADSKQGIIIMEYLTQQIITPEMRSSDKLYILLAQLLQKIHNGPKYPNSINIFDTIQQNLETIKTKNNSNIPVIKIEEIINITHKALASYTTATTPCHNDIQPNNLIFLGNGFKAVDYETAAQSDPYFDVATIAIFYCFFNPKTEQTLLTTYLAHQPTPQEKARLYLMKQIAWIHYALVFLKISDENINLYSTLEVPSYGEFVLNRAKANKGDFERPENKVKFAKVMINLVIANSESQEFSNALKTLENKKG